MKKSVKKLLCSLLVAIMCLSSVPLGGVVEFDFGDVFSVKASAARELVDSGDCGADGNNVTWKLYDDGELIVSGEGATYDYEEKAPFAGRTDIKSIVVEDGVTTIGTNLFYGVWNAESLKIGKDVTTIGRHSFVSCFKLKEVIIPDNVTYIGECAFGDCHSMQKLTLSKNMKGTGVAAFGACVSLIEINIPEGITTIDDSSFFSCWSLKNLTMPKSVTTIGGESFCDCQSLESIAFSENTKSIGVGAFNECYSLNNVVLPDSIIDIGELAFGYCYSLEKIEISQYVESIGSSPFAGCVSLDKISVDPQNKNYISDDKGVLLNKDKTELIQYPCGSKEEEYIVPETVKKIGDDAFNYALYINEVQLPNALEICGADAFSNCYSLKEITLPQSISKIDSRSFDECYYLDRIYVKSMDAQIGSRGFNQVRYSVNDIEQDDFVELYYEYLTTIEMVYEEAGYYIPLPSLEDELDEYMTYLNDPIYTSTLYCHSGSTAETYAVENGVPYVLTHFFEGDWIYDYDKMIRYRKCIHCDEIESEPLETTEDNDTEIIAPTDPDKDFTVDKVESDSSKYIVVEDAFKHHGPEHWYIVKAFDINMTDKNGVHVQPDGMVRVMLPFDSSKHGVYKVYRVNDDGTLTDMHAFRQGNSLVFDTDHFSLYVIVDESETPDTGSDTSNGGEKTDFISKLFAFITKIIEMITGWFKK